MRREDGEAAPPATAEAGFPGGAALLPPGMLRWRGAEEGEPASGPRLPHPPAMDADGEGGSEGSGGGVSEGSEGGGGGGGGVSVGGGRGGMGSGGSSLSGPFE